MKLQWAFPDGATFHHVISGDLRIIGKADYWLIKDWTKGWNILRVEFNDPGDPHGTEEEKAAMDQLLLIAELKLEHAREQLPAKPPRGFYA